MSALRKVSHPGLVQVTTCDQRADGVLFALMERLEGESLQQRLDRLRLLEEEPRLAIHLSPADSMQVELPSLARRSLPTPDALSQIIDAVPTGIVQLSIDGAIVMTNAPAQRMFGLTADDFSKLTVSDLEIAAADNVKRVRRPDSTDWSADPGLTRVRSFLETKTVCAVI